MVDSKIGEIANQGRQFNDIDIHVACWNNRLDYVQEILALNSNRASSSDTSEFGENNTPLHYAAYIGSCDIMKALVSKSGVNINARNDAGCTPLYLASQQGRNEAVQYLISKNARINITDSIHGFSPIDVANSESIRQILLDECDSKVPKQPEKAPQVIMTSFGVLEISWQSKPTNLSLNELPISGYVIQVLRSQVYDMQTDASSSEDEDINKVGVLREEYVTTGKEMITHTMTGVNYPFYLQVQIAPRNACGDGEFSMLSESVICCDVPTVIDAPSVKLVGRSTVQLTWQRASKNGNKITAYRIEAMCQDGDNAGSWESIGVFTAGSLGTELKNLIPNSIYRFRVIAANKLGKSKPGPKSSPIKVPGNLRPTSNRKSENKLIQNTVRAISAFKTISKK